MIALATPRLVLRPWSATDLEPLTEMCADSDVMRFIGDGRTRSATEAQHLIAKSDESWQRHGWGLFAIERIDTGTFIGFCGLARPELLQPLQPAVEIGWRLRRRVWGQGFATEAAAAVVDWAFTDVSLDRLLAVVQLDNLPSHRVAAKLGMHRDQRTIIPESGIWVDVYEISRSLWQSSQVLM